MKNKKALIVIVIIILLIAIGFGIIKARYNANYLYNDQGTISNGKQDLIEHLKNVEDLEERKKQIDFSVSQNILTQEEANDLY